MPALITMEIESMQLSIAPHYGIPKPATAVNVSNFCMLTCTSFLQFCKVL